MKEQLVEMVGMIKLNIQEIEKLTNEIQCALQNCSDENCKKVISEFVILIQARTMISATTFLGIDTCINNMRDKPGEKVW